MDDNNAEVDKPIPSLRESIQAAASEVSEKMAKGEEEAPEPVAAPAKAATDKPVAKGVPDETVTPPPQPEPKKYSTPKSWDAKVRDKWDTLPPEVQEFLTAREDEVHKGFTKLDEERNFGKAMRDAVNPYLATIRAEGGTAEGAVSDLLNTAYRLRNDSPLNKAMMVQQIIQQYGVDMNLIQPGQRIDPVLAQTQNELHQIKMQMQQQQQLQTQEVNGKIQSEIQAFAADPANIYFDQVSADMAALLSSERAANLQEAYDMAIWAKPDIRSTLMQKQALEAEEQRKRELAAKRNAAVSVTGSPVPNVQNSTPPQNKSLRDELRDNLRAASSS